MEQSEYDLELESADAEASMEGGTLVRRPSAPRIRRSTHPLAQTQPPASRSAALPRTSAPPSAPPLPPMRPPMASDSGLTLRRERPRAPEPTASLPAQALAELEGDSVTRLLPVDLARIEEARRELAAEPPVLHRQAPAWSARGPAPSEEVTVLFDRQAALAQLAQRAHAASEAEAAPDSGPVDSQQLTGDLPTLVGRVGADGAYELLHSSEVQPAEPSIEVERHEPPPDSERSAHFKLLGADEPHPFAPVPRAPALPLDLSDEPSAITHVPTLRRASTLPPAPPIDASGRDAPPVSLRMTPPPPSLGRPRGLSGPPRARLPQVPLPSTPPAAGVAGSAAPLPAFGHGAPGQLESLPAFGQVAHEPVAPLEYESEAVTEARMQPSPAHGTPALPDFDEAPPPPAAPPPASSYRELPQAPSGPLQFIDETQAPSPYFPPPSQEPSEPPPPSSELSQAFHALPLLPTASELLARAAERAAPAPRAESDTVPPNGAGSLPQVSVPAAPYQAPPPPMAQAPEVAAVAAAPSRVRYVLIGVLASSLVLLLGIQFWPGQAAEAPRRDAPSNATAPTTSAAPTAVAPTTPAPYPGMPTAESQTGGLVYAQPDGAAPALGVGGYGSPVYTAPTPTVATSEADAPPAPSSRPAATGTRAGSSRSTTSRTPSAATPTNSARTSSSSSSSSNTSSTPKSDAPTPAKSKPTKATADMFNDAL